MMPFIISYFTLLIIYCLGRFCISMAYGIGPAATVALATLLCAAVIVTLWKSSGNADGRKQAVWGIFAGFFLWCFFGELLQHERILSLVTPVAAALLVPCMLLVFTVIYKKAMSAGMRFALGHFGCIWLLHSLLTHQEKVGKDYNPALYMLLTAGTGMVFILISLSMLFKTIQAGSNNGRLAFLLPSFIFFWATMETVQAIDFLPDYTGYAYWTGGNLSGTKTRAGEETVDTKIACMQKRYAWDNGGAERRAYAFIKKLPSPHFIDDFEQRLEQQLAGTGQKHVDEKLFYRVMEESFVDSGTSAFKHLLTVCVRQFKAGKVSGQTPYLKYGGLSHQDMASKLALIRDRYRWDTVQSRDLAEYLLKRFSIQFLSGDSFIEKLDTLLKRQNTNTLGEEAFCRAMEEHFAVLCRVIFKSLMKQHLQSAS